MIGAIISAVGAAAAATTGAVMGAKANRTAKKKREEAKRAELAWFEREYNTDATQRADAQRMITKTADAIRNRNREIAATQAVVGGTEEAVQAQRAQNNEALAETSSAIAAKGAERKDAVSDQHMQNQVNFYKADEAAEIEKRGFIQKSVQDALGKASNIASSLSQSQVANATSGTTAPDSAETPEETTETPAAVPEQDGTPSNVPAASLNNPPKVPQLKMPQTPAGFKPTKSSAINIGLQTMNRQRQELQNTYDMSQGDWYANWLAEQRKKSGLYGLTSQANG